jgi:hypothetical protein
MAPISIPLFMTGLLTTSLLGFAVKPFLRWIRSRIPIPDISEAISVNAEWKDVYSHPDESGFWIGIAERVVMFAALFLSSWEFLGIWVGFKVASKWEAWNHMGYVPDVPDESVTPLRWARARRIWAAQGYATFVVGTAANGIVAALGAAIAKNTNGWLDPLFAIGKQISTLTS